MQNQNRTMALRSLASLALTLGVCLSSHALVWQTKIDVTGISSENYDLAISPLRAHVAYEHAGHVYYATRTPWDAAWTTVDLGSGATPSVALGPDGTAYVAFQNGGTIHVASSADAWAATPVVAGSYGSLDVDGSGVLHLMLEGNYDGDGYTEIALVQNAGSGWSDLAVLHDGWYDSGYGNYFSQMSLAALPGSGYVYSLEISNWGGRASWSSRYPSAIVPGGNNTWMEVGWNAGSELSRQAISAGDDRLGFAFATSGTVYASTCTGGIWSGFESLGAGGQATVDAKNGVAVAFQNGGVLRFAKDGAVETVLFEGAEVRGIRPFLVSQGEEYFLLYRDEQGTLSLLTTAVVPEPSTVACLVAGALLAVTRRRKH